MSYLFSYKQEEYDELTEGARRYLDWNNEIKIWRYDDCKVTVIGMANQRVRIVLRRNISGKSRFMKSKYSVNLMMGFIATKSNEPKKNKGKWEIKFDVEQSADSHHRDLNDVKIWSENEKSIWDLYEEIIKKTGKPPTDSTIFSSDVEENNMMVPIIYQPRIDAWENFLREIHVNEQSKDKFEITLVFQDEQLRKHVIVDMLYRIIRLFKYKRTVDIENFYIHKSQKDYFTFPGIYSDKCSLFDDSTHFDKPEDGPVEKRDVKYYFKNKNHPIVFVNTSNHALAPQDNNHDMWKWEYIPWSKKIPIKLGKKSREEVEKNQKWILRKKILQNLTSFEIISSISAKV